MYPMAAYSLTDDFIHYLAYGSCGARVSNCIERNVRNADFANSRARPDFVSGNGGRHLRETLTPTEQLIL
jgi:hypothetical protein